MYAPPDAPDHPLLEGKYIGFYRLECDENLSDEICTPEVIRLVNGKVERIFSVDQCTQDIHLPTVERLFQQALETLGITEIVAPFFCSGEFLGFSRFLDLDSEERKRRPDYGNEVKNWIEFGTIDNEMYGETWAPICRELGILIRGYSVDRKCFFQ